MTAAIFLFGAALLGVGLFRRALGTVLSHAEQALWGLVAGWALTTAAAYMVARALGRLSFGPMLALTLAVWLFAILLWLPELKRLARRRLATRPRLWRSEYKLLVVLLCLFAPAYVRLFRTHMLQPGEGGLYSGGSAWYDMGLHAAITTSFVYGENFPPVYTPLPPEQLLYPFLPDFQTALLVVLGMDLHTALVSTAVPLALALTGILYLFALRVLRMTTADDAETLTTGERATSYRDAPRRLTEGRAQTSAALSTVLFLLNGGLGFLYFFRDWRQSGKGLFEFWSRLEVNYANMGGEGVVWTNIIADTLLPQRASLFGMPLALMVFALFAVAWRDRDDARAEGKWDGWRVLLVAGLLAGLLPAFHTHSYAAVGLVSGFLFLLRPRRAWLAFWLPAVLLALPRFTGLAGHVSAAGFVRFQPGWRGHNETNWPLFWLRNVGLPTLLVVPAWLKAPRAQRLFYLAFVALIIFSLLVVVTPNDYDNIKLMYYWYAATCVLVAAWLVRLASSRRWLWLSALLAVASIASGALAVRFETLSRKLMYSREEMAAAEFLRARTAPRSLFLTAPSVHQPVLSLAGRAVLRGDTAWLWSHGYPFAEREADVRAIYAGRADALELLRYYRVDYVYLGPRERQDLKADQDFFDRALPVLYRGETVAVYDARQLTPPDAHPAPGDPRRLLAPYPPREFATRLDLDPYQPLVEFPRVGFALYRYHKVLHGRAPRYTEFMDDLRALGRGVYPGAQGWHDVLEENKRALTDAWAASADFRERYESLTDEQYVAALYANAGVEPSRGVLSELTAALGAGRETRASLLRRVAEDPELYARGYNAAYVLLHYFGYLRRNPDDPPDKNLDGYNFWLRDLDRTGDYRSLTRVFIESGEYKDRQK